LFEAGQGRPALIGRRGSTPARAEVSILAALRAQPRAIAPADALYRQCEQNLLAHGIFEQKPIAVIEADVEVFTLHLHLFVPADRPNRPIKQVEVHCDGSARGFETTGAGDLDGRPKVPLKTNLRGHQFRPAVDFQDFHLPDVVAEINPADGDHLIEITLRVPRDGVKALLLLLE